MANIRQIADDSILCGFLPDGRTSADIQRVALKQDRSHCHNIRLGAIERRLVC